MMKTNEMININEMINTNEMINANEMMNANGNVQLYNEITDHLLIEEKPSVYMNRLSEEPEFQKKPFVMLKALKKAEQSPKYHPEGNVWNHTMLVLDEAAKVRDQSKEPKAFMWAALLHDIGKPGTTKERKGKITSYDHDKEGEILSVEFLRYFTEDTDFIRRVSMLVRYHMHMLYVLKKLPYGDIKGLVRNVDAQELALLCRCDRLGRTGADVEAEDAEYQLFAAELQRMNLLKK